jgi:hypothetical protein
MLIGIAVRLIIPDTTAVSARRALQQAGLHDLADLRREVCWGMDIAAGIPADPMAERLLTTDVLVNYNKHRGRWWLGSLEAVPAVEEAPARWGRLLVEDRDDPEPARMQRVLTARLGFAGVGVLRRATLWSIGVPAGLDVARVAQGAADLLLTNPHGQIARVIPPGPAPLGGMPARQ